jgi:uncharacterized integral membrane protein (TIGR00698 family)
LTIPAKRGFLARPQLPGILLTAVLAAAALGLKRAGLAIPDVLLALILGAFVVNTPLAGLLGLAPGEVWQSRFAPGLNFVGKTVLKASVVLMGLRIEARMFGTSQLLLVGLALCTALPATFFLTHALAVPLRVPRRLADLVAAGTMICGASAVNAVAPVIGARREEQGIALATVFLFSAVALVAFRYVSSAVGFSSMEGGIWSGLAVNDLASAVSVGAQMGPGGAEMAAASKSARIMMLAPILLAFAMTRGSDKVTSAKQAGRNALRHVPPFVAGFVALAFVRAGADALFGAAPAWRLVLATDRQLVGFAMVAVSAGIGLHMKLPDLLVAGARAVVLGAVAATAMAGLTLTLLVLGTRAAYPQLFAVAALAIAGTFSAYRMAGRARQRTERALGVSGRRPAAAGIEEPTPDAALMTVTGRRRIPHATGEFPVISSET